MAEDCSARAASPRLGYRSAVRKNLSLSLVLGVVAVAGVVAFVGWKASDGWSSVPSSPTVARVHAAAERMRQEPSRSLGPPDPRRAEALARLGRGEHDGALELLKAIQRSRPDDIESVFYEALALKESKRYSEAKVALERALDAPPQFRRPWTALYYYGWVLLYAGDADGARAAFTAFLEFDPDEPDAHFGIGLLDLDRPDLDAAESRFRTAITLAEAGIRDGKSKLVPDLAKSKARLAEVLFERDRNAEARDLLREALKLAPQAHEAWYLLHRVSKKLGDSAGAAEALARHAATKPASAPTNP